MRILLALPGPLFPADTGGKIRTLNIFSRVAKSAEVHAVSFADPLLDSAAIATMRAMFASYTPVFRSEVRKYSPRFYREVIANQFASLPYFLAKCNHSRFHSAVQELMHGKCFDLLFCDFLQTAVPLLKLTFSPRVVFEHNVEFALRKRKWETERHLLRKVVFGTEWRRTRVIEGEVCRSFDHVIAVSREDQRTLQQEFGIKDVSILPTGVDTDFFCPREDPCDPGRMVFVGSMDWDPNEDGVLWFVREIYPRIRQEVPDARFSIVGRSPSSRLCAMAAQVPGIEITGRVPDVRSYLSRSKVVVVPLRVGGGTRIKIPEAMAMGKAVVSTLIGAEGLSFKDGQEICIAESPEQFAQAVVQLLKSASLRTSIGTAARQAAVRHSWTHVVAQLENVLERVVQLGNRVAA
jgi:glycosyltransferase involved in cell wall biosynthesis